MGTAITTADRTGEARDQGDAGDRAARAITVQRDERSKGSFVTRRSEPTTSVIARLGVAQTLAWGSTY